MTPEEYNYAVDLWNNGKNTKEIAEALGLCIHDLHPIIRAATRECLRLVDQEGGMEKAMKNHPLVKLQKISGEA